MTGADVVIHWLSADGPGCLGHAEGTDSVAAARVWVVGTEDLTWHADDLSVRLMNGARADGLPTRLQWCDGGSNAIAGAGRSDLGDVLVVLCGIAPWTDELADAVTEARRRGAAVLPVVEAVHPPETVLPPELLSDVAAVWSVGIGEVVGEILDLVLLREERGVFISYHHASGGDDAYELYDQLSRRQVDVYLDRFRTRVSHDFVQRIDDELVDKGMVVVIESSGASTSRWVQAEIATALLRGYGLIGLHIGTAEPHPLISPARRVHVDDRAALAEPWVVDVILEHHRAAILDQRRRRVAAVHGTLDRIRRRSGAAVTLAEQGQVVEVGTAAAGYAVAALRRPAGIGAARRIDEHVSGGTRPVVQCPRPVRAAQQADLGWIDDATPVAVVPDGALLEGMQAIVDGRL